MHIEQKSGVTALDVRLLGHMLRLKQLSDAVTASSLDFERMLARARERHRRTTSELRKELRALDEKMKHLQKGELDVPCAVCKGQGHMTANIVEEEEVGCEACGGTGRMVMPQMIMRGPGSRPPDVRECARCSGSGKEKRPVRDPANPEQVQVKVDP